MGNNLSELRNSKGWTQEEAAGHLGVSRSQWIKLERGERQLTQSYIDRLSKVFEVSPSAVFSRPDTVPLMGYLGAGAVVEPDFEQVPEEGLDQIEVPFPLPDDMIALKVKGDSMLPKYDHDDVLIVYREQRKPIESFYGMVAAVRTTDGRRFVKTIMRGQGNAVNLISWNAAPIEAIRLDWVGEIFAVLPPAAVRKVVRQGGIQGQLRLRA